MPRALLAIVIGMGVAGLARGDEGPALPAPVAGPVLLASPEHGGTEWPGRRRPVKAWLQKHGYCCFAHHNWQGCGSFKASCKFAFGSCRTFFGEPCLKGPTPPPIPGLEEPGPSSCSCR
jgi:hypothetical protein